MYDTTKPYTKRILKLTRGCREDKPSSTDGIGTKGFYHWQKRTFRNAVLDALAMNLNDMALMRAKVHGLHNHIIIPEDDEGAIYEIVETLVCECLKRNILIKSGETSIHRNFPGLEISISVDGDYIQEKENIFKERDSIIGIGSSGLHSNGFTKVREVFSGEYRTEFTEPTLIYYDAILEIIKDFEINGMAHITGGAFTKLKPFLNGNDVVVSGSHSLSPQQIFYELYRRGISDEEMYKTFNCGVGFILSTKDDVESIVSRLSNFGFRADKIGEVVHGKGKIKINSMFSQKKIVL